jgi:hypothetical protein
MVRCLIIGITERLRNFLAIMICLFHLVGLYHLIYEAHSASRFDGASVSILHRYKTNPLLSSKRVGERLQKQVLTSTTPTHRCRFLWGYLHPYH